MDNSELSVNKLLELAKKSKKDNNKEQELHYLIMAYTKDPCNLKVLHCLVRFYRRCHDMTREKEILEKILEINPDGNVLYSLINIAKMERNIERERELIILKQQIEPKNKKLKTRLERLDKKEEECALEVKEEIKVNSIIPLCEDVIPIIEEARSIIYGSEDLNIKSIIIKDLLVEYEFEIGFSVLVELYKAEGLTNIAIDMIKRYKYGLEDPSKIKLANLLFALVNNRKTMKYDWDCFWNKEIKKFWGTDDVTRVRRVYD